VKRRAFITLLGGAAGPNAAGAARNAPVRSGIRNLRDLKFLAGVGVCTTALLDNSPYTILLLPLSDPDGLPSDMSGFVYLGS